MPNKKIIIREAVSSDKDYVIEAMISNLTPFYGGDHKAHAERIFSTHIDGGKDNLGFFSLEQKMFICCYDDVPAGVIHLVGKRQETYKISPLIVFNQFQGKHRIGQYLLEYAEKYAREMGARQLYCTVAESNTAAFSFFRKNNFIIAGTSDSHYKDGVTEIMMYKNFLYEDLVDISDRIHISVIPFSDKYEEPVKQILLSKLPIFFKGIDEDWIKALFDGYRRRNTKDVNQKYKIIYVAVDNNDNVLGVAAGTPKKGEPIKLMPLVTNDIYAFNALLRDVPYLLKEFGRKLYIHIVPSIEETILLQLTGWHLDAVLPAAYHDEKVTQQWSLNIENLMHHLRVKKTFLEAIKMGEKTLEIRVKYPHLAKLTKGDKIMLFSHTEKQMVELSDVRTYKTFDELIEQEEYKSIIPNAENKEQVLLLLKEIYPPQKEETYGPLVLDIKLINN